MKLGIGLVALVCAWSMACSGSSSGGDSSEPIAKAELTRRYAQVVCESRRPCCEAQALDFDRATCEEEHALLNQRGIEQFTKNVAYDPQAAADCLAVFQDTLVCGQGEPDHAPGGDACGRVFVGTLSPGATCESDRECIDGYCDTADEEHPVCVSYSTVSAAHGKRGDECERTCEYSPCASAGLSNLGCYTSDGLFCGGVDYRASEPGTCQPLLAIGEPCVLEELSCQADAFCDGDSTGGICKAKLANGEVCTDRSQCQSGLCVNDGVCAAPSVTAEECGTSSSP